ncbi:MAG TPA: protein kinase, partial [Nannocystaceae bacterium]|nr:protein kinase [Nannocystaceae bacterium]
MLWVGAGFGALAGRPSWEQLLRRLVQSCPEDAREALGELLEQGRLRTVLAYVHRHLGDDPLGELLETVSSENADAKLSDGAARLSTLPWRACFATTYADLVQRIFTGTQAAAGKPAVISHTDVHHLSLRDHENFFILRTPPTGRAMRADGVFFDLVEEVVRTRHILFLGFEPDDPDLVQVFDLLDRVGRGNRHFAILPWVTAPEAEELADRFAIEVIPSTSSTDLVTVFGELERACAEVAVRPSDAAGQLAVLDLGRAVRAVELRADLAVDTALGLDVEWIEHLMDALPGGSVSSLSTATLLRTGSVMLAHRRVAQARRCFQQVITHGAGREFSNLARFNLALTALVEGDRAAALDGLATCAEVDRSLAIVPPRVELREVVGRTGTHIVLVCRDRESKADFEVAVATLPRPVGLEEQTHFHTAVSKLATVDHPAIKGVHGGFADGRLFGLMREPTPGFVLADTLDTEPMPLAKVVEVAAPILEGLAACHAKGVTHRNLNPSSIVVGTKTAVLRGFGFPPIIGFARPSVRAANRGYMAPELLNGGEAGAASDVYSVTAVLYRMLSGRAPAGAVPRLSSVVPDSDPRLDDLLHAGLNPEPSKRPSLGQVREQLADILATPEIGRARRAAEESVAPGQERVVDVGVPRVVGDRRSTGSMQAVGVPEQIEETVSAPGTKILLPEDPNDLEAWAWILERRPTHTEAREAVARIEAEARAADRWDRVAEALKVRAQHTQLVRDRVDILSELVGIYEQRLAAPASAFETMQQLLDERPPAEQYAGVAELARLAETTGRWSQFVESLTVVAERTTDSEQQADLYEQLGGVLAVRLGASERAVGAYEKASELRPRASTFGALVPLYRKLGRDAELAQALLSLADLRTGAERHGTLTAAAKVLRESLGEEEAAFDVISVVLAEDPDEAEAVAMGESLARALDRKPALVDILARRAHAALADSDAVEALREAAALAGELGQDDRAIELLQALVQRVPGDREATERLVARLRTATSNDPTCRTALIDALASYVDFVSAAQEKAALLLEAAELLDQELDGKERAADCRERVLELLPIDRPAAKEAAAALERWYKRQEDHAALGVLLERQANAVDADDASR